MSDRTYKIFMTLVGLLCSYVVVKRFLHPGALTLRDAMIQGFFVGFGLAVVTIEIFARIKIARINGWITTFGFDLPGNGMFTRAAYTRMFPGPIAVPKEAMYWKTGVDGGGHALRKAQLHHALPTRRASPADAFWSLTMANEKERFVANPLNRYLVGDRSGLLTNADGSVDVYIQNAAPTRHESNWLPAPLGNFRLWLRTYLPGAAVLDGTYTVPPVVRTR